MPIYLKPPAYQHGGPDGQGWNRFSIASCWTGSPQCALRPRSYATLFESRDTRRAAWGSFGACVNKGRCDSTCAVTQRPQATISPGPSVDRLLFLIVPEGAAYAGWLQWMPDPDPGKDPLSQWGWYCLWEDAARLEGWTLDGQYTGVEDGFWMRKAMATPSSPEGT